MSSDSFDTSCQCDASKFYKRYKEQLEKYFQEKRSTQGDSIGYETDESKRFSSPSEDKQYTTPDETKTLSTQEETARYESTSLESPTDLSKSPDIYTERRDSKIELIKKYSETKITHYQEKLIPSQLKLEEERKRPEEDTKKRDTDTRDIKELAKIVSRHSRSVSEEGLRKTPSTVSRKFSQTSTKYEKVSKTLQTMPAIQEVLETEMAEKEVVSEKSPSEGSEAAIPSRSSTMNTEKMLEQNLKIVYPDKFHRYGGDANFLENRRLIFKRLAYLYRDTKAQFMMGEGLEPKKEFEQMDFIYKSSTYSTSSQGEYEQPELSSHEPWMSESQRLAILYLKSHRIFDFFHYLGSYLVSQSPANPIFFLIKILDRCLLSRHGLCEPPVIYQKEHIASVFDSMDRMKTDFININQYHTGMYTLRVPNYHPNPPRLDDDHVRRSVFVREAYAGLLEDLRHMISCSKEQVKPQISAISSIESVPVLEE